MKKLLFIVLALLATMFASAENSAKLIEFGGVPGKAMHQKSTALFAVSLEKERLCTFNDHVVASLNPQTSGTSLPLSAAHPR